MVAAAPAQKAKLGCHLHVLQDPSHQILCMPAAALEHRFSRFMYVACLLTWLYLSFFLLGKSYVNLTATGKLMVRGFTEHLSGSYTCTLSYRVLQPDMKGEREIFKTYRFMVYGKRSKSCLACALLTLALGLA